MGVGDGSGFLVGEVGEDETQFLSRGGEGGDGEFGGWEKGDEEEGRGKGELERRGEEEG